jgi:hypothetical protein
VTVKPVKNTSKINIFGCLITQGRTTPKNGNHL